MNLEKIRITKKGWPVFIKFAGRKEYDYWKSRGTDEAECRENMRETKKLFRGFKNQSLDGLYLITLKEWYATLPCTEIVEYLEEVD